MDSLLNLADLGQFEYKYLLDLALILVSTKLLGMLTRRVQLPQVVGALLAGLILGPAFLGVIHETEIIKSLAEVGVIVLMFTAGMETDVKELKNSGLKSFVIALFGVIVPILVGFGISEIFHPGVDSAARMQNIFIGVILTATSVSISVETLKELGKLSTRTGNAILGAALIDDVLGIIALTVITSFAGTGVALWTVIVKILAFFAFCAVIAILVVKFGIPWINKYQKDLRRFNILAFTFCLLMAFCSEYFFGVSDITGAFVAGLILSNNRKTTYMLNRFDTVSYLLLSPMFFASVGLKVEIDSMSSTIIWFSILLLIGAVLSKIIGCGLGAKICGYTNLQSTKIGIGMVSRGEVALIVATKGAAVGLMTQEFFAPIIIVVVVTTIVTPIMLKAVYKWQDKHYQHIEDDKHISTKLLEKHAEKHELEKMSQVAIKLHNDAKQGNNEK